MLPHYYPVFTINTARRLQWEAVAQALAKSIFNLIGYELHALPRHVAQQGP